MINLDIGNKTEKNSKILETWLKKNDESVKKNQQKKSRRKKPIVTNKTKNQAKKQE